MPSRQEQIEKNIRKELFLYLDAHLSERAKKTLDEHLDEVTKVVAQWVYRERVGILMSVMTKKAAAVSKDKCGEAVDDAVGVDAVNFMGELEEIK